MFSHNQRPPTSHYDVLSWVYPLEQQMTKLNTLTPFDRITDFSDLIIVGSTQVHNKPKFIAG